MHEGPEDDSDANAPTGAMTPRGLERARAAFRTWLSALTTDAEAAMAAALAYEALEPEARDAWLDVLREDAPGLGVPAVALYAPLLSVETDEPRRARMLAAMAPVTLRTTPRDGRAASDGVLAFRGVREDGARVALVVSPVYLEFVEVLRCRYVPGDGFVSVSHDPLRHMDELEAAAGAEVEGVAVEATPLRVVVEELAHVVLAERRAGKAPRKELVKFAHLFGPDLEGEHDDEAPEPSTREPRR